MEAHVGDWLEWAEGANLDPRVFAFIKYRPEMLHRFDPKSKEKAFASPRSWEFMSQVLQQMEELKGQHDFNGSGWEDESRLEFASGIVGREAGTEFVGFLRIMEKLVSIDSILLAPAKADLPKDAAVTYALTYALAERADRKNLAAIITYIDRLSKEFGFLFFRRIDQVKPDLKKSREFIGWVAKNHDFV
jgi:hypothetical protein